ncbi:MAG: ABC transporter ATP-binding protein [Actinomycetota bacterium]
MSDSAIADRMRTPTFEHLLRLIRPFRRRIALATLLAVVQSALLLPAPILLGYAFENSIPNEDLGELVLVAAVLSATILASGLVATAAMSVQISTATAIGRDLRISLQERLFQAPRSFFDRREVGGIHDTVVTNSLRTIVMFGAALNKLVPDAVIAVGVSIILLVIDARLAVVTLVFLPTIILASRFMIRRLVPAANVYYAEYRDHSTWVMRAIRSQDLIRSTASEDRELRAAEAQVGRLTTTFTRFQVISAITKAVQQSIIGLAGALLLLTGGYWVIEGNMSLGELLAFYAAFAMLRGPAGQTAGAFSEVTAGWQALKQITEFVDHPEVAPYQGRDRISLDQHGLAFESVSFGYDERPVLETLSFTVPNGAITVLAGPNGSGKTTVVNLLLGFYRPDAGRVLAGDVAFDELDLRHLRRQIGLVPQEPFLLAASVLDNITYGDDHDPARLDRALELSGADAVIAHLPDGLETMMGEDGGLLSGGQRQRIAIARALYREPSMVILDEPTNHLDEAAVGDLLGRIREVGDELAVLLISHHQAVVELADHVVRLRTAD